MYRYKFTNIVKKILKNVYKQKNVALQRATLTISVKFYTILS